MPLVVLGVVLDRRLRADDREPLFIPTGRLPSRGWLPVLVVFELATLVLAVVAALEENVQASDTAPLVHNPIGIDGLGDIESFFGPGMIVILVGGATAVRSR